MRFDRGSTSGAISSGSTNGQLRMLGRSITNGRSAFVRRVVTEARRTDKPLDRDAPSVTEERGFRSATTYHARGATYRLDVLLGHEMAPLLPLYRRAFERRYYSPEWLGKKYAAERGGVGAFSCVAFSEGREAVGALGVLPWPIRFGDRTEVAGQLVDGATSGEHRGRGLFVRLGEMMREQCEAAGISFLFGFPNADSYPVFVHKLGYQTLHELVDCRLPVRTLGTERVARRVGAFRPLYERHVTRTFRAYVPADPVLENSLLLDGCAGTDRDSAFYAYKSSFAGSRVIAVNGGRAWLKIGRGLLIGDLEASSEDDLERTAHELERLAARLGVHQVLLQASKATRLSSFFANRFRTSPTGLPVIYSNLCSGIPSEELRFTLGDLDNF